MDNLITCPGQEIFIGLLIFYFKKTAHFCVCHIIHYRNFSNYK